MENTRNTITLLRNDKKSIAASLNAAMKTAKEAYFCVAFLKMSGMKLLEKQIENAANSKCKLTFFIGTDFYQTEPDALWFLFDLSNRFKNVNLFLFSQGKTTFHPKIYLTLSTNKATALVGSSNLTQGGLSDNFEAMVCIESSNNERFIGELLKFFKTVENHKRAKPVNPIFISQYERRFNAFKRQIKKAEKEAQSEIAKLFNLNSNLFHNYLSDYLADMNEQADWDKRILDYRKALQILNSMNSGIIISKASFLDKYERLVGKTG